MNDNCYLLCTQLKGKGYILMCNFGMFKGNERGFLCTIIAKRTGRNKDTPKVREKGLHCA
jgi:hypothetical protein